MFSISRTLLTFICVSTLLSACGFHLRGDIELPKSWQSITLISANPNGNLNRELTSTMGSMDIVLEQGAEIILKLGAEQFHRRSVSVGAGARANRYELKLSTQLSLQTREAEILIEKSELSVLKLMNHDPSKVVGEEEETRLLRAEMRSELVQRILLSLRSRATR